jgi:N-acetylglutamate synthase-like GNAT family acetyltransferase
MQEAFWYIAKDHRRGLGGMRLLKEIEQFAKDAGISRVFVGRNHSSDPDMKVGGMLERMGYSAIETNYCKTICQNV